ncbi:hypothetical protein K456DRAFT_974477 [Colletotrichum gloeosporioides 23]|nr:hypothetical protein K456DRAFT_974477 [Colletotrichum gloeosporioides 23]
MRALDDESHGRHDAFRNGLLSNTARRRRSNDLTITFPSLSVQTSKNQPPPTYKSQPTTTSSSVKHGGLASGCKTCFVCTLWIRAANANGIRSTNTRIAFCFSAAVTRSDGAFNRLVLDADIDIDERFFPTLFLVFLFAVFFLLLHFDSLRSLSRYHQLGSRLDRTYDDIGLISNTTCHNEADHETQRHVYGVSFHSCEGSPFRCQRVWRLLRMVLEQPDSVCIAQGRALRHDSIGGAVFFFLLSQRFAHRVSRSRHVLPTLSWLF